MVTDISTFSIGLPIQVRDTALAIKDEMPKSDVNKEYYTQNIDKEVCCIIFLRSDIPHLKIEFLPPYFSSVVYSF